MRIGQVIRLNPEQVDEYERIHRAVWSDVLERIARSGIRDYTIYRYGNLLFSTFTYVGDDFGADMAEMAADDATRRWWALCGPMQRPVDDREEGEWWHTIPEIFHVD